MADPEQLYQEVLQEEQQKGSSGPVAEGRAKAARARAEAGSPHPKEPKWWPGAQPHFEGDGQGPSEEPAAEAAPEPEPAAEAAPEPEPAAEPAAESAPEPEPAEQPAAQAPAEQPAAQAPAEQPAAQAPAEQPAAQAPAEQTTAGGGGVAVATRPTVGVTHGTPSGNRLRPEDAVATEAQFEGQRAVYDRRKLIDELVATGVPAVAASDTGRPRAPWLSVLYLVIPVLVIAFLVANGNQQEAAAPAPPPATEGGGGGGVATDTLVAADTSFDADTIELKANKPTDFTIDNQDSALHNLVIFPSEEEATDPSSALYTSPDAPGGTSTEFTIDPLKKGEYYFHCQYHANMNGNVEVT